MDVSRKEWPKPEYVRSGSYSLESARSSLALPYKATLTHKPQHSHAESNKVNKSHLTHYLFEVQKRYHITKLHDKK